MQTSRDLTILERYYAAQVAAIAARTFGGGLDPARLHAHATVAVAAVLRDGARLTAFVPELALRAVREAIEARDAFQVVLSAPRSPAPIIA